MKNLYYKYKSHFTYSFKQNGKKALTIIMIIIFNTTLIISFKHFEANFRPTVSALAIANSQSYVTEIINKSIMEIPEINAEYSSMCSINRNENGEITSIITNTNRINEIKEKAVSNISDKLNKENYRDFGIPAGNLTQSYLLHGRGPKIPIRILYTSSPSIHFENSFEAAGFNQTKHKISLVTKIDIQIVLPYETIQNTVVYEAMIMETIIVGKVPNVYVSK